MSDIDEIPSPFTQPTLTKMLEIYFERLKYVREINKKLGNAPEPQFTEYEIGCAVKAGVRWLLARADERGDECVTGTRDKYVSIKELEELYK